MEQDYKSIQSKIISKFLQKTNYHGICGFWIDEGDFEETGALSVYIVIDLNFLESFKGDRGHLSFGMRTKVKNDLKDALGFDNISFVGSISKPCN